MADAVAMQRAAQTAQDGEVDVSLVSPSLAMRPGGSGSIDVIVRNRTDSAIHGEAQLLSPFGSWRQTRPWTAGFAIAAGQAETLRFELSVPPTARPGEQWWAVVKLMYFGRVAYTEPAEVTVG